MLEIVLWDFWDKNSWSFIARADGEQVCYRADRLAIREFVSRHKDSIYVCMLHPDTLEQATSKIHLPNTHNLYDLLDDKQNFTSLADEMSITYEYPIDKVMNRLGTAYAQALASGKVKRKETKMAETKPEEPKQEDYSSWSVWRKIAKARELFAQENIEKSGKNNFLKCRYYQLEDIVPAQLKIFTLLGLFEHFTYSPEVREVDCNGVERICPAEAVSKVINIDKPSEYMEFRNKWVDGTAQTPIQAVGSAQTYLRRYNKMQILDLVEPEIEDNEKTSKLYVVQQDKQSEMRQAEIAKLTDKNREADEVICKQLISTAKKLKEEFKDNAEIEKFLKSLPNPTAIKNREISQEAAEQAIAKAAEIRQKLTKKE